MQFLLAAFVALVLALMAREEAVNHATRRACSAILALATSGADSVRVREAFTKPDSVVTFRDSGTPDVDVVLIGKCP